MYFLPPMDYLGANWVKHKPAVQLSGYWWFTKRHFQIKCYPLTSNEKDVKWLFAYEPLVPKKPNKLKNDEHSHMHN